MARQLVTSQSAARVHVVLDDRSGRTVHDPPAHEGSHRSQTPAASFYSPVGALEAKPAQIHQMAHLLLPLRGLGDGRDPIPLEVSYNAHRAMGANPLKRGLRLLICPSRPESAIDPGRMRLRWWACPGMPQITLQCPQALIDGGIALQRLVADRRLRPAHWRGTGRGEQDAMQKSVFASPFIRTRERRFGPWRLPGLRCRWLPGSRVHGVGISLRVEVWYVEVWLQERRLPPGQSAPAAVVASPHSVGEWRKAGRCSKDSRSG
jgi:hypothetical protein